MIDVNVTAGVSTDTDQRIHNWDVSVSAATWILKSNLKWVNAKSKKTEQCAKYKNFNFVTIILP